MAAWERRQCAFTGNVLLWAFVLLLVWYFWASYAGHQPALHIQERQFTYHDDLFAVDGARDGNAAAVGKFGLILLARDGGQTWNQQASGTGRALSAISFADSRHVYVGGSGGTILASSDGGSNWKAQTSGTKDQLLGVFAATPANAYAVGAFGTLLSTNDGGTTWRKQNFPWEKLIPSIIKNSGYLEPNLNAVYFLDPRVGWIVGEFGLVLGTRDGGQTWEAQNYGENLPQLFAVYFRDENSGWAVGQVGTMLRSVDGGKHWRRLDLGITSNLYGISMDGERGIAVGDGIALASRDGGTTWNKLPSAPEDRWLAAVTLRAGRAVAVGQAGTIRAFTLKQ